MSTHHELSEQLDALTDERNHYSLAHNRSLYPEVARALIDSAAKGVPVALGANPSLTPELQELFAKTHGAQLLVSNPGLDPSLRALPFEEDRARWRSGRRPEGQRYSSWAGIFAQRHDLTDEEVELLLKWYQPVAVSTLARNNSLSEFSRDLLLSRVLRARRDVHNHVADMAKAGLITEGKLAELLRSPDPDLLNALAASARLSEPQQMGLIEHARFLSMNRNLSEAVQELLSRSRDRWVLESLACNEGLCTSVARKLHRRGGLDNELGENTHLDPELLLEVARRTRVKDELLTGYTNPRLPPFDELSVRRLLHTRRHDMVEYARTRGVDVETFVSLLDSWHGTLGDLLKASGSLGPDHT